MAAMKASTIHGTARWRSLNTHHTIRLTGSWCNTTPKPSRLVSPTLAAARALPSRAEWMATPSMANTITAKWVWRTPKLSSRSASEGSVKPATMQTNTSTSAVANACGTTSSSTSPPMLTSTNPSMNVSTDGRERDHRANSGPDPSSPRLDNSSAWLIPGRIAA